MKKLLSFVRSLLLYRVAPRVTHLILHVTSRCNLRCKTCFVTKGNHDLPLPVIADVAKALPRLLWLDIGGGEPFLRDDLPAICRLFPGREITLATNGFDSERIESVCRELCRPEDSEITVAVSLDGFEETHDEIRGRGSFGHAVETIRRLKTIPRLQVKINTVLCQRNSADLVRFMRFARGLDAQYHSILLLRGQPADPDYGLPPLDELEAMRSEILPILMSYPYSDHPLVARVSRNYHSLLWRLSLRVLREGKQPIPCLAGEAHVVVYADGSVAPCELLPQIGNVKDTDLATLLRSAGMGRAKARIRRNLCACTHNCNMVENVLFNLRTYPALLAKPAHGRE